ncbi:MAG: hypothetical protein ABIT83_11675, partial [Massilia sp.]
KNGEQNELPNVDNPKNPAPMPSYLAACAGATKRLMGIARSVISRAIRRENEVDSNPAMYLVAS